MFELLVIFFLSLSVYLELFYFSSLSLSLLSSIFTVISVLSWFLKFQVFYFSALSVSKFLFFPFSLKYFFEHLHWMKWILTTFNSDVGQASVVVKDVQKQDKSLNGFHDTGLLLWSASVIQFQVKKCRFLIHILESCVLGRGFCVSNSLSN